MENKPVVVEGYEVDISANGGQSPGDYANFTKIVERTAGVLQGDGKKALKGPVIVRMASGCSFSGYTFVIGFGVMSPNCDILRAENMKCYKEGATGDCMGLFLLSATPFTPYVCSCGWEISKAGQDILTDGK